jgi:hypothetical protein
MQRPRRRLFADQLVRVLNLAVVSSGSQREAPAGKPMTRFKELRRIEQALEHKNAAELRWALDYCIMRCKLAVTVYMMRKQGKYWRQMESKVRCALENLETSK